MINMPPTYKDVKSQTIEELIREKKELVKSISQVEKRLLEEKRGREGDGTQDVIKIWYEDEETFYYWHLERLIVVLQEIIRREEEDIWLFDYR